LRGGRGWYRKGGEKGEGGERNKYYFSNNILYPYKILLLYLI
jgi:hypothetical protein